MSLAESRSLCRLSVRLLRSVVLLVLWVCAIESPHLAYAWPHFWGMGRRLTTENSYAHLVKPDRTIPEHPPLLFLGKAERTEQARALWQEVEAKGRLSSCWKRSLLYLGAKCTEVLKEDTSRSRLALFMATCDADSDGRMHPSFHCGTTTTAPSELSADGIRACVRNLSDTAYAAFLQYRLHADVLCAYLQEELYQERTEVAVAAMRQQMEGSTEVLDMLQQSGREMYTLVKDTHALQHEVQTVAVSLKQQLDTLHHGHAAALQVLQEAADDILQTSTRTDTMLGELHAHVQEAAAEALASVQALRHHSITQYAAMEEQTRGVLHLIDQVDSVQRLLTRQSFSWNRVLGVLGWVTVVLVATSLPHTAAARLPAIALAVLGTTGLPLLQWWTGQEVWLLLRTGVWQCICAAWAVGLVCWSAYCYTPPEVWQRRVAREEAERVWRVLHCPPPENVTSTAVLQPYVPGAPSPFLESHLPITMPLFPRKSPQLHKAYNEALRTLPPSSLPSTPAHQRLLCIAAALPPNGEGEDLDAELATETIAAPHPTSRASSLASAETEVSGEQCTQAAPTERKRGRPHTTKGGKDEGNTRKAKAQRAEVAPTPRKATPTKQRGSKRASSRISKRRG
ncbi:hypothetical protein ABL78_6290 [Leptomonas seymouri]|uniref:Uncharacterized protein n=1 Tax=Leptomonas seymouri TaxID=5684 RepID=A0A0N0P3X8_LEPSE|nr:hypothetical protein ABL78_6290 [Leptomonas seymouri]|eukprot:KPI84649.1 hypothetical protein ABL78_6290 [Leptomonas seymouri]